MTPQWTLPQSPLRDRDRLIVGISGGSDSVALLLLLREHSQDPARQLIAAHVNYGLRGKRSDKDEELVRDLCRKFGIPLRVLRIRGFATRVKRQKRSLQDLAREVRYGYFERLSRKERAWGVGVAHHREDQAETVLDRFLRGSGARGLSGLKPVQVLMTVLKRPLKIWRPLLAYSKKDLQAYLRSRRIVWREDASNRALKYRRNQIRHEVLPFLSRWNSRFSEVLARMGEVAVAEDQFLEELLGDVERQVGSRWQKPFYTGKAVAFARLPLALKRRWVRHVAERLTDEARGLPFDRIEEVIRLWEGREKGPRDVGYGLSAGQNGTTLFMKKNRKKI